MGLTGPGTSHEPGSLKSNHQEPVGSMYDCFTLVPKEIFQKTNFQEPVGSTSYRLTLILNNILHISTQNNIVAPLISNMNETDITQKYNSLHQKYVVYYLV